MALQYKKSGLWRSPRLAVVSIIILLLAGAGGWYFISYSQGNKDQENTAYTGPTEEEKSSGDEEKVDLAKDEQETTEPEMITDGRTSANVIITDASQYDSTIEVRSYISNIFEDGKCTVTFSKDGSKFQKTTDAFTDSSYTICTRVAVPRGEFSSAGSWTVTVEYSSERYYGAANQILEVK